MFHHDAGILRVQPGQPALGEQISHYTGPGKQGRQRVNGKGKVWPMGTFLHTSRNVLRLGDPAHLSRPARAGAEMLYGVLGTAM